jgi:cytochrome c5
VKRMLVIKIVLGCLFLACLYAATISDAQQAQTKAKQRTEETASRNSPSGEERFQANCGRCHNAPEDLSPREARAVLRQMRVRAMLSAEDEQSILKYLAP